MTYDLTLERLIDAPPEVVFDTIVDPEAQPEIFVDQVPGWELWEWEIDLRVGGAWKFVFGATDRTGDPDRAAASSRRSTAHTVSPTGPRCSSGSGPDGRVHGDGHAPRSRWEDPRHDPSVRPGVGRDPRRVHGRLGGSTRSNAQRPRGLPVAHRPARRSHRSTWAASRRPRGRRPWERGCWTDPRSQDGKEMTMSHLATTAAVGTR